MIRLLITCFLSHALCVTVTAQEQGGDLEAAIRGQLQAYVKTFNSHDTKKLAEFWTEDAVSVQDESGERTEGRESLEAGFAQFFADYPQSKLVGDVEHIRSIGAAVAIVEGTITLQTGDGNATQSTFTAVLQKQGDRWLIASSHECDVPTPPTPYDALKELEFLVGTWQDDTEGATVVSSFKWSPSQAFLIRSYTATFDEGEPYMGTQIFGWDPQAKQIRAWTFNSDGSFGDGTVSENGGEWSIKMNRMLSDGRIANGTHVITRVDENTIQVRKIGESVGGVPVPAGDPITVVRMAESGATSGSPAPQREK